MSATGAMTIIAIGAVAAASYTLFRNAGVWNWSKFFGFWIAMTLAIGLLVLAMRAGLL